MQKRVSFVSSQVVFIQLLPIIYIFVFDYGEYVIRSTLKIEVHDSEAF